MQESSGSGAWTRRWTARPWIGAGAAIAILGLAAGLLTIAAPAGAIHDTGLFELDGDPADGAAPGDDWSNVYANTDDAVVAVFQNDPANSTIFTGGGSKDDLDTTSWRHTAGSVPDKTELTNAYAARYIDDGGTASTTDDEAYLYFGADRLATNGDAQMGFWFFQQQVVARTGGTFGPGSHTDGDVLVLSNFTNGGAQPNVRVFRWNGPGGTIPGSGTINGTLDLLLGEDDATATCGADDSSFCGIVNTGATASPWPYTPKSGAANSFAPGAFYEGGVNLSDIGLGDECFSSFLAETRSSASTDATLKDFVGGNFGVCGTTTVTTPKDGGGTTIPSGGLTIGADGTVDVRDHALVSGTGVANPPTPTGSVRFFICGPTATTSTQTCESGGTAITPNQTLSTVSPGVAQATSAAYTITRAGRYCFRAEYLGDSNYPAGANGVASSDSSSGECFVVNPRQPTISTQATAGPVPVGSTINDVATLANTADRPDGSPAGGTITFTAYGPHDDTTTCTTVAYTSTVAVNGDGNYSAASGTGGTFTPTQPKRYNWIAVYNGDSPNTSSVSGACGDANESSEVIQLQPTIATTQDFIPNDTAVVAVGSGGGNLAGSVRFRAFTDATCSGPTLINETRQVSGALSVAVSTTNTTVKVSASTTIYWLVEYTSTNPAHLPVTSACGAENTVLTITNG